MKKAILAVCFLCVTATFAQKVETSPQPALDTKFMALAVWYSQLSVIKDKWNATFMAPNTDMSPTSEEAVTTRAVINEQLRYFIECANRYGQQGSDCDAVLRYRVVQHDIEVVKWELAYGGRPINHDDFATGVAASNKLKTESDQLKKEIDVCFGKNDKL